MLLKWDTAGFQQTRWYEYASRFLFGGIVTVFTGLIAHAFGPAVGGLFLAFPAIFPASASLIEKHEREKRKRAGLAGTIRGRRSAGTEAAGAAMGSAGLAVFALITWKLLPQSSALTTLGAATLGWAAAAAMIWYARRHLVPRFRRFLTKRRSSN